MLLASCGGNSTVVNGHWDANLSNPDTSTALAFSAQFMQQSGTAVTVSNFSFNQTSSCFTGQTNKTATFTSTGNSNGVQTGNFGMTISTTSQGAQNVLTMQGNLVSNQTNEKITGTWSLTGVSGCNGGGTFLITPLVSP
jgi:hypothetical protein